MKHKIIIAGGRSFCNPKYYPLGSKEYLYEEQKAFRQLSALLWMVDYRNIEIVSGGAKGADLVGERFALGNQIALKKFPANWDEFGKKAGIIRNEEIGLYADRAIVFWDGESRGSKHMIDYMKSLGKPTKVIKYKLIL